MEHEPVMPILKKSTSNGTRSTKGGNGNKRVRFAPSVDVRETPSPSEPSRKEKRARYQEAWEALGLAGEPQGLDGMMSPKLLDQLVRAEQERMERQWEENKRQAEADDSAPPVGSAPTPMDARHEVVQNIDMVWQYATGRTGASPNVPPEARPRRQWGVQHWATWLLHTWDSSRMLPAVAHQTGFKPALGTMTDKNLLDLELRGRLERAAVMYNAYRAEKLRATAAAYREIARSQMDRVNSQNNTPSQQKQLEKSVTKHEGLARKYEKAADLLYITPSAPHTGPRRYADAAPSQKKQRNKAVPKSSEYLVKDPVVPGQEAADEYATVHTVVAAGDQAASKNSDTPAPASELATTPVVSSSNAHTWARDLEILLTGLTGTIPSENSAFLPGSHAAIRSPHVRKEPLDSESIEALTVSDLKTKFAWETITHPDGFKYTAYFVHPNIVVADVANINDLINVELYSADLKNVPGKIDFCKESKLSDDALLGHVKGYLRLFDGVKQHGSVNQKKLLSFIETARVVDVDDINPDMGKTKFYTDLSPAVPHDADGREIALVVLSPTKSVSAKVSQPDGVYSETARKFARALEKAKNGKVGQASVTSSNPTLNTGGYGTASYVQVSATEFDFGEIAGKKFVVTPDESILHEFGHVRQNAQAYDKKDGTVQRTVGNGQESHDIRSNINELRTHGNPEVLRALYSPDRSVEDIQRTLFSFELADKWRAIEKEIDEETHRTEERISKLLKSNRNQAEVDDLKERLEDLERARSINTERLANPLSEEVHGITDWNSVRHSHIRQYYSPPVGSTSHQIVTMPLHPERLSSAVRDPGHFADWVVSVQSSNGKLNAAEIRKWATSCGLSKRALGSGCSPLPSKTATVPEVEKIVRQIRKDINVFSKTNDILSGKVPVRSGGNPTVVYRVDSRAPKDIEGKHGFKVPKEGTDNDVFNHIWDISTRKGSGNTNFVSTSQDINQMVAQWTQVLGGNEAWVYVIAPGENFISVQSELERLINDPKESTERKARAADAIALGAYKAEWDAQGGIELDNIHLAFRIDVDASGNVAPVKSSVWFNREGYEKSRSSLLSVFTACTSSRQRRDALCARFDRAELREQVKYYGIDDEPAVREVLGSDAVTQSRGQEFESIKFAQGTPLVLTASNVEVIVQGSLASGPYTTNLKNNDVMWSKVFRKGSKGFSRRVAGRIDNAADLKDLALYLKGFYDLVKSGDATLDDYLMHGIQIVPGVGNALGLKQSVESGEWDGIVYHGASLALLPYALTNPYAAAFLIAAEEAWGEYQNHKNWVRTEEEIGKRKESFKAAFRKNWEIYLRSRISAVLQLSPAERQALAMNLVLARTTAVKQIELDYCQFKHHLTPQEEVVKIAARKGPDGISACIPPIVLGKRIVIVNGVSGDERYRKAVEARQKIQEVDAKIAKLRSFFVMNPTSPEAVDFESLKDDISQTLRTDFTTMVRQGVHNLTEELAGAQDGNYPNLIKLAVWLSVDNSPSPPEKPYSNSPAYVNGRWRTWGMEEEILQEMQRIMLETTVQCENWMAAETRAAQDGRLADLRVSASGGSNSTAAAGRAEVDGPGGGGPSWSVAGAPVNAFPDGGRNITLSQEPVRLAAVLGAPVRHGRPAEMTLKSLNNGTVTMHIKKTRREKVRYTLDGSYGMRLEARMSDGRNKTLCFTHQQTQHTLTTAPGVSLDVVMEDLADRSVSVHLPNSQVGNRPNVYSGAGDDGTHSWNGPQQNELSYTFQEAGDRMQLHFADDVRLIATYLGGGKVRYRVWNEPSAPNVHIRIGNAEPVQVVSEMNFDEQTVTSVMLIR
ncbi:enterotoxin A family protein [Streptomyces sp. NPDC052040]|uniref:enterotoxin A family protein n=1 Tax=Streptomyces sp. NPDC052040 TaxID=3365682 RepID=UPI0037D69B81